MRLSTHGGSVSSFAVRRLNHPVVVFSLMVTALLFSSLTATLHGQSYYAELRGIIRDPAGAVVPGAKVSLVDEATNLTQTATSKSDGEYVFTEVVPATYRIVIEAAGFKKLEREHVIIVTQSKVNLDLALEIGAVTQTVQVTAAVPLIETGNASMGQVLNTQQVADLPDFGRNLFTFAKVTENVVAAGHATSSGMQTQSAVALTSVAGGMLWQNSYIVDGINITSWFGEVDMIPSLEAVEEMKLQVNTYDAEMGREGGGVYNTTLKSGTNDLHGTAYGHIRRTDWDANLFFNNASHTPLSPIPDNTLAFSLGGPVYIPHLYNGKNRTFFFIAGEGYDDSTAYSVAYYLPTAAERLGNFSNTLVKTSSGLVPAAIYDPTTTPRTAFAGAIIPTANINAVGKNIASYYPMPTSTPAYYGANDATASGSAVSFARQEIGKVDEQLFTWWRASFSEMRQTTVAPGPNYWGTIASPEQWRLKRTANATAINNLLAINPTTVVAIRYGFNRFPNWFYTTSEIAGFDPSTLGFPTSYTTAMMGHKFPIITVPNLIGGDTLSNGNGSLNNYVNNVVSGIISHTQGRHSLKAGFDFRRMLVVGSSYGGDESGNFTFNGVFTQSSPTSPAAGSGIDFADLLLGYPSAGTDGIYDKLQDYTHYYATYIQDDWRVSNRLTLNLGLRWDRENGLQELHNRLFVNFDKNATNPLATNVPGLSPAPKGVVVFAGQNLAPTFVGNPNPNKLAPRIGIAYQIDHKTVIRGGFGVMWAPQDTPGSPYAPAAYAADTTYIASNDGNAHPANSLSNPFPAGLLQPLGTALGSLTGVGQSISVFNPTSRSPKISMYSIELQRELPGGVAISAGYLGTRGTHLTGTDAGLSLNQNVLDPSYFSMGAAALNAQVANPFYQHGGVGIIGGATIPEYQLLLPFPTFGQVTYLNTDLNHSHYDSLVVKGQKRLAQGLTFASTLTWGRSYDLASVGNVQMGGPSGVQNPFNVGAEYSLSNWQPPIVFSNMFTYQLPAGKGRRFLSQNAVLDYLLGGWQLNGVNVNRSGYPIAIQQPNLNANFGYGGQRPNATGVAPGTSGSLEQRLNGYINYAAFSNAPQFTFGNVSRYIPLRGPGMGNWDLSLFKSVPIKERVHIQFRIEALNAFNTPLFVGPSATWNPAGAGSFGHITSQDNPGREMQLALRLIW